MPVDVESARREWEDGNRRFEEAARDPAQADRLHAQLDAVSAELRKRVGGTFTLRELAEAYGGAERWMREAVAERAPAPGWQRHLAIVGDAAFHLYSRGAADYVP
jgi:hypothetical protein